MRDADAWMNPDNHVKVTAMGENYRVYREKGPGEWAPVTPWCDRTTAAREARRLRLYGRP